MIEFHGVGRRFLSQKELYLKNVSTALSSGRVFDKTIENEFASMLTKYFGRRKAAIVGSGTDALFFSLLVLDLKPGDLVLCPAYSYVATASTLKRAGLKVRFFDVNKSGVLDEALLSSSAYQEAKLLVGVNLFGNALNWPKIQTQTRKLNLKVLEDSAQAFGARSFGKPLGSFGDLSVLSFSPVKNFGGFSNGGAILTDDESLFERINSLRFQGLKKEGGYAEAGFNSLIPSDKVLQLMTNFDKFEKWQQRRAQIAQEYLETLQGVELVDPLAYDSQLNQNNWDKFVVLSEKRPQLQKHLLDCEIETKVHYPYILPELAFVEKNPGSFLTASFLCQNSLSLPIYPELTDDEVCKICKSLKQFSIR